MPFYCNIVTHVSPTIITYNNKNNNDHRGLVFLANNIDHQYLYLNSALVTWLSHIVLLVTLPYGIGCYKILSLAPNYDGWFTDPLPTEILCPSQPHQQAPLH